MSKGALKGALIGGGVGFGIPAAYNVSHGTLNQNTLGGSTRFGLLSAIPGALIGALLTSPDSSIKLEHPDSYLDSLEDEDDILYKDLMRLYNANTAQKLTKNDFRQLYLE
jgi:hypothetical protein